MGYSSALLGAVNSAATTVWCPMSPMSQDKTCDVLAVNAQRRVTAFRAFTLIETLVVIGVIALLLGLLLPTLQAVKKSGERTVEMSAARQLMVAYNAYANVHNGAVLPGYWQQMEAWDASGDPIEWPPSARYPWRLAPYLDYNFRGMYTNENEELLERLEYEEPGLYQYAVSLFPSLGLNTTWIGGDQNEGGFLPPESQFHQTFGRFYITKLSEARRPQWLIVFASARGIDTFQTLGGGILEGNFYIRSPYFTSYRWSDEFDAGDLPAHYGYLSPRYGGSVVSAFLDSHVDMLTKRQLKDMRYWADQATRPDWVLEPQ
ncbi:MAG: type II secretion system protein [Planctomycetes bacterium]|nr:type II secretion system protein [Planctomycetota bacterium]